MVIKYDEKNEILKKMIGVVESLEDYDSKVTFVSDITKNNTYCQTPRQWVNFSGGYERDTQIEGFSYVCKDESENRGKQPKLRGGHIRLDDDFIVCFENETLMPLVINPPTNLEEALVLVQQDPRYAKVINPAVVTGETEEVTLKNIKLIKDVAAETFHRIMLDQSKYGVSFGQDELSEMKKYSALCKESIAFFMQSCREYMFIRDDMSKVGSEQV